MNEMRETDLRQILELAQTVAAELVAEAVDPAADLTMVERRALLRLSLAVEAQAARAVRIEPRTAEDEVVLMRAIMAVLP